MEDLLGSDRHDGLTIPLWQPRQFLLNFRVVCWLVFKLQLALRLREESTSYQCEVPANLVYEPLPLMPAVIRFVTEPEFQEEGPLDAMHHEDAPLLRLEHRQVLLCYVEHLFCLQQCHHVEDALLASEQFDEHILGFFALDSLEIPFDSFVAQLVSPLLIDQFSLILGLHQPHFSLTDA